MKIPKPDVFAQKTQNWGRDHMEEKLTADVKISLTPHYCNCCTRWCISNLSSRVNKICRDAVLLALKKFSQDDCWILSQTARLYGINLEMLAKFLK